jgi:hypothetical protein
MLKFDNTSIILTEDKTFIIQRYAYGEPSGYPAECRINAAKRERDLLIEAIEEYERREVEGVVIDFKRHG